MRGMVAWPARAQTWGTPPRARHGARRGLGRGRTLLALLAAVDLGIYALAWQVGAPPGPTTEGEIRRDLGRRMRISRTTLTMLNYSRPNLPPECRRALEPGYGLIDPCE